MSISEKQQDLYSEQKGENEYKHQIIMIPGDGIGPEVMAEAEKILKALQLPIQWKKVNWGINHFFETGKVVPANFLEIVSQYDAILLGSLGDSTVLEDYITLDPLIKMRQSLDQFLCLRPAKYFEGIESPLKHSNIDVLIIRENSEGEYCNIGGCFKQGSPDEVAVETAIHSRKGIERVIRCAFETAAKRKKCVTLCSKSNAMKFGMGLWDRVFEFVAHEYPDIQAEKFYMDSLCAKIICDPSQFDVIVGSNLFCDILSDLTVAITGSLGMAPSANINPSKTAPSLFEPVHGSALDIKGKGICNPIAMLRATGMMIEFLGYDKESILIEKAIQESIKQKWTTRDIGGTRSTIEVGNFIENYIITHLNN